MKTYKNLIEIRAGRYSGKEINQEILICPETGDIFRSTFGKYDEFKRFKYGSEEHISMLISLFESNNLKYKIL